MVSERKKDILFYSIIITLIASMLCILLWMRSSGFSNGSQTLAGHSQQQEKLGRDGADILSVTIEGAVISPGTYYLNEGARMEDLLELAGGFRSDAQTGEIDQQMPLTDGQTVRVKQKETVKAAESDEQDDRININSATASQLEQLPGIGKILSARIVAYRDQHGRFVRIEEIRNVPGIGEKRYESLKDYIKAE
jgi:competence protein ComEA